MLTTTTVVHKMTESMMTDNFNCWTADPLWKFWHQSPKIAFKLFTFAVGCTI